MQHMEPFSYTYDDIVRAQTSDKEAFFYTYNDIVHAQTSDNDIVHAHNKFDYIISSYCS